MKAAAQENKKRIIMGIRADKTIFGMKTTMRKRTDCCSGCGESSAKRNDGDNESKGRMVEDNLRWRREQKGSFCGKEPFPAF